MAITNAANTEGMGSSDGGTRLSSPQAADDQATPGKPETRLDRLGIPHVLRWGFVGVLVVMVGHGVEAGFVAPYIGEGLGDNAVVPVIVAMYGVAVIIASYMAAALSDLFGPRRVMLLAGGDLVD